MSIANITALETAIRAHIVLQPGERLYAIVDSCQAFDLASLAQSQFGHKIYMLFKGAAAQTMREVAPYLIPINLETNFIQEWSARWGTNTGVLFTSFAPTQTVFRHLRHIFVVSDEKGQNYFFRFYDPRVLRVFLPTCTIHELRDFFGPVEKIICECETNEILENRLVTSGQLEVARHFIQPPVPEH